MAGHGHISKRYMEIGQGNSVSSKPSLQTGLDEGESLALVPENRQVQCVHYGRKKRQLKNRQEPGSGRISSRPLFIIEPSLFLSYTTSSILSTTLPK